MINIFPFLSFLIFLLHFFRLMHRVIRFIPVKLRSHLLCKARERSLPDSGDIHESIDLKQIFPVKYFHSRDRVALFFHGH